MHSDGCMHCACIRMSGEKSICVVQISSTTESKASGPYTHAPSSTAAQSRSGRTHTNNNTKKEGTAQRCVLGQYHTERVVWVDRGHKQKVVLAKAEAVALWDEHVRGREQVARHHKVNVAVPVTKLARKHASERASARLRLRLQLRYQVSCFGQQRRRGICTPCACVRASSACEKYICVSVRMGAKERVPPNQ